MRFSRSILFIVLLMVGAIAVLYFFAPLGLDGSKNEGIVKVDDSLMNYWDNLGIKIFLYNMLWFKQISISFLQDNTWWMFGMLGGSVFLVLPFVVVKSKWPYIFIGFLSILIILFGSFVAGGLMLITSLIGIIGHTRWKIAKAKKVDYKYLYREYIN